MKDNIKDKLEKVLLAMCDFPSDIEKDGQRIERTVGEMRNTLHNELYIYLAWKEDDILRKDREIKKLKIIIRLQMIIVPIVVVILYKLF